MEIVKYTKKGNGNYQILFSSGDKLLLSEDIILKYNLLYKKDIDSNLLTTIINENQNYSIYNKCVKYISVRLRSTKEIYDYIGKYNIEEEYKLKTIERLKNNNLLNDEIFTKAYIKDKFNFTSNGPYRIKEELIHIHQIDQSLVDKYIYQITDKEILNKIDKQVQKQIKSNHNKPNLRDRIYKNLISSGYPSNIVVLSLNNHNL